MVRSTARFSCWCWSLRSASNCAAEMSAISPTCTPCRAPNICRLAWAEPAKGEVDYTRCPTAELAAIVRGREAFALYGWKPYMHNPRLKRWLHRIDRADSAAVGRAGRHRHARPMARVGVREFAGARLDVIPDAGHFPHWEQPEDFVQRLSAFADSRNA